MNILRLLGADILILAAARAQPAPIEALLPPVLVPQLQLGMAKEQMKALWPKMLASLGNGCTARIEPGFRHGELDTVTLHPTSRESGGECMKFVTGWAHRAYGKPTSEYGTPPNAGSCFKGHYGGLGPMSEDPGCETSEGVQFTRWQAPSRTVLLKVQGDDWSVTASR